MSQSRLQIPRQKVLVYVVLPPELRVGMRRECADLTERLEGKVAMHCAEPRYSSICVAVVPGSVQRSSLQVYPPNAACLPADEDCIRKGTIGIGIHGCVTTRPTSEFYVVARCRIITYLVTLKGCTVAFGTRVWNPADADCTCRSQR